MRVRSSMAPILILCTLWPLQEILAPVPVEQEPHHHLLLKNNNVMVLRVTLEPGERTLYHVHSVDDVAVRLAHSQVTNQIFGEMEGSTTEEKPGEISLRTLREHPLTHRVHNVGQDLFDVLDVELLQRPEHATQSVAGPVAGENPSARVYKWILAPGAATAMHTHERPYLIVAVTDFVLKMIAPDGQTLTHEIKRGDIHWVSSKVTHSLANAGSGAGEIVEIEMK
jgi:quercetin dioxygenase-like cupin family protein